VYPDLERWLTAGYAVVRTDYEGLGTPGVHPYLIGRSEGRSVLDIVRAARAFDRKLGRRVILSGHSQGGQAALWAAALAPKWAPELAVRGTVAFAPASHLSEQAAAFPGLKSPLGITSGLIALIVRGLDAANPGRHIARLLTPQAARLYPQTLTRCLVGLSPPDSFGGLAPAAMFRPRTSFESLARLLDASDPENLHIRTRVLIEQGLADTTVFPSLTTQLVGRLRAQGASVRYRTYRGIAHVGIVSASIADATRWIAGRLGGRW
jgi:pimeloyl-ACP methyl ester carboxylesterase